MKVLFLDLDGCLNQHEPLDPEVMCGRIHADKVALLNHVLRTTGANIVLSSAWRYFIHRGEMDLSGLDWLMRSHGIMQNRVISITRPDTMERPKYNGDPETWPVSNERGQQITDWLAVSLGMTGFAVDRYAVLDDLDLGISAAGHPLVLVDGKVGLTPAAADRLIDLLGKFDGSYPTDYSAVTMGKERIPNQG